jgi:hypothetical protein
MRQAKWDTLPDDVRAVHERFETWRQSRLGRSRIPAALWIAATELGRRHGVHRVARALGLNDRTLKQRILATAPTPSQPEPHAPALASSSPSATHETEASAPVAAPARAGIDAPLPAASGKTPAASPQPATADPAPTAPTAPAKPVAPPMTNSAPQASPPRPSAPPAFIQLPWPALAPTASAAAPPRCVVELLHPGGARMTITLEGSGGAGHAPAAPPCASGGLDLAALVQSFWSRPA